MADIFDRHASGLESPATRIFVITPDDGADLSVFTRAINVSGTGFINVTTVEGDTAPVYVSAGGVFPIRARRIWATGTDASGIVGLS